MAMNMNAALTISAKVDGANNITSLNRSLQAVEGTAKGLTGAMRGLAGASAGLSGALGALAPLASIAGLVGLAKGSLDAGDKMFDLAQKTGVSVEALARFKKAASTSGTDIDSVSKALVKLSKGMVEAAATGKGKAADSLKALGLSATDASGKLKGADQVTLEIANRFKSMADGPVKAALAVNLFGKAGADMIPMLNMGGQAIDKLSVKMTTAFAQKADEYSDKLTALSGKVGAFGADLLIALLPALNAVTDAVSSAVSAFNALPAPLKNVAVAATLIAIAWGPLAGLIKGTTAAFIASEAAIQGVRLQMKLAAMEGIPLLNAAIMSIPGWGWALAGAAALAGLLTWIYKTNEGFRDFVDNLADVVANDFKAAMNQMGQQASNTGKGIGETWTRLVNEARWVSSEIAKAFNSNFGFIGEMADWLSKNVGAKINEMVNAIPKSIRDKLGIGLQSAATGAINALPGGAGLLYAINAAQRASAMGPRPQGSSSSPTNAPPSAPGFTPDIAALAGSEADKSQAAQIAMALKAALGLTDAQAAGPVGNLMRESGLNPRVNEGGAVGLPRGVGGYGIAQWTGTRQTDLIRFAGGREQAGDMATQLRFMVSELMGPEAKALAQLKTAQSPEQAAYLFDKFYERSGVKAMGERQGNARRVFNEIAGTGPGAGLADFARLAQEEKALTATREQIALDVVAAGYQKEYVLVEQQINDLGLRQNAANAAGNSILSLQIDKSKEILATGLVQTKLGDETNRKLQESIANKDTFNQKARDSLIYAEYEVKSAERAEVSRARTLEIDQKIAQERKRQASEQASALRDIGGRSRYKAIGDLRGGEALQRQQEVDGLQRKIGEARAGGREEEANRLEDQLKSLQNEYKKLDALANSASYGVAKGIRGYLEDIGSLADSVANATKSIIQNLEENLSNFFETGKFNFKDFASYAIKQLQRVVLQQLIMKPLMNALGGLLGGGGGGAVNTLFNPAMAANGKVFASNGIQPFANGGIVSRSTLFPFAKGIGLMGEAGPEAIMPLRRGADGKLGVAGGGGTTTINVSVDAKGSSVQGDNGQSTALARAIAGAVQTELIKQKRPGGILTS